MLPINLPSIITPALLSRIRSHPQLPKHSWYIVSSVTLSCLNRPDEIPKILRGAIGEHEEGKAGGGLIHEEQLKIARRMREGLVKSSAICGLPKVRYYTSFHKSSFNSTLKECIDTDQITYRQSTPSSPSNPPHPLPSSTTQ